MKLLYKVIGFIVLATSIIYFANNLITHFDAITEIEISIESSFYITISILLYTLALIAGALMWAALMRATGDAHKNTVYLHIHLMTQFAKYIPGNFAHHIGRVVVAKKHGLNAKNIISTMMIEIMIAVLVSASLAMLTITQNEKLINTLGISNYLSTPLASYILIFFGLALCLYLISKTSLLNILKEKFNLELKLPSIITLVKVSSINMGIFVIFGIIIILLSMTIFHLPYSNILYATGAFSVAWLLGFLTPGSPGGIGVREAILIALLTPVFGASISVGISILLRLITTVGDGVAFLIGLYLKRYVVVSSKVNKVE